MKVIAICPNCAGAGFIWEGNYKPTGATDDVQFKGRACARCNGFGRLAAQVCPTCHTAVPDDVEVEA